MGKLECDMQIEFYPGFSGQSTSAFGSHSYEVLRSSNTTWKKASEASFEKMVFVVFRNSLGTMARNAQLLHPTTVLRMFLTMANTTRELYHDTPVNSNFLPSWELD